MHALGADSLTKFFTALDTYLKESKVSGATTMHADADGASAGVRSAATRCCAAALPAPQTRFSDLFAQYDTGRKGALGARELARLVRDMTPRATEGQVKYFALVLDENGDNRITADEILTAAKDIMGKLRTSGTAGEAAPAVVNATASTLASTLRCCCGALPAVLRPRASLLRCPRRAAGP